MNIDIQHMLDELEPAPAPAAVAVTGLRVSRGEEDMERAFLHLIDNEELSA